MSEIIWRPTRNIGWSYDTNEGGKNPAVNSKGQGRKGAVGPLNAFTLAIALTDGNDQAEYRAAPFLIPPIAVFITITVKVVSELEV